MKVSFSTFKVRWPFAYALGMSLPILAALLLGLELILRLDSIQPYVDRLNPRLGGRHLQMEEKLADLDRFSAVEGEVDCIFLGSSLVWLGFNPQTFQATYEDITGENLRCFNLGIETLPANAAGVVAQVVVERYRPRLLLYGTSARDYAIDRKAEDNQVVVQTPWLQYQLGIRTPRSWLASNSHVYRYIADIGSLIRIDDDTWRAVRNEKPVSMGFLGKTKPAQPVHYQAAAKDAAKWLRPYEVLPENLEGLQHIAEERNHGVQVIVVEMPVSTQYLDYFSNGSEDYQRFVDQVGSLLESQHVVFLRPHAAKLVPQSGWWDRSHLNKEGADAFSRWIAENLARLVVEGEKQTLRAQVQEVGDD